MSRQDQLIADRLNGTSWVAGSGQFGHTAALGSLTVPTAITNADKVREGTLLSKSFNTDLAGTSTSRSFPRYTCTAPAHGNPMREIKELDWKVLRRVHLLALERFCERVLAEIDRVSHDGATSHHARYLQIFRILQQRDREMARLFDNPRRSHALTMLAQIRSQGLMTEDEFSSLSPETRGAIQMLLGAG